jgi:tetratricopeptide (TPR) repeat protein
MRLSVIVSFLIISSVEPLLAQNAYVRLGKQADTDGDFKAAVMQLEKACLVDSTNANAMWMLGYSYFHSDNFVKTIVAYSKVIAITPADAYAYYYRAMAKRRLGKDGQLPPSEREKYWLGAIFDYTRAIEINPSDSKIASFYQNRGIAYREYGLFKLQANLRSYDKARGISALRASIDDLQRVLANDPSRGDISTLVDLSKENLATSVGHH